MIQRANKGRSSSIIVAADNSKVKSKNGADYRCNGEDDNLVIKDAIAEARENYASEDYATTVKLLTGKYNVFGVITVSSNELTGVQLEGESKYGTILECDPTYANPTPGDVSEAGYQIFHAESCNNFRITNMTLNTLVNHAISGSNCHNCIIDHVVAEGASDDNITLHDGSHDYIITECESKNATASGIEPDNNASNAIISNNIISGCGTGIDIHGHASGDVDDTAAPHDLTIMGNVISTPSGVKAGIVLDNPRTPIASNPPINIKILNNQVIGSDFAYSLIIREAQNCLIQGNTFEGASKFQQTKGSITEVYENIKILNNYFESFELLENVPGLSDVIFRDNTFASAELFFINGDNIRFIDNDVLTSPSPGVSFKNINGGIIRGNAFNTPDTDNSEYESFKAGVRLAGTCDSIIVKENRSVGTLAKYGIYASDPITNCIISENNLKGNTQHVYTEAGSEVKIYHNLSWITENGGTATVAAEGTYVDVTHGLSITPVAQDIVLIPTNSIAAAADWYISNVGATTFRINAPAGATFGWQIN